MGHSAGPPPPPLPAAARRSGESMPRAGEGAVGPSTALQTDHYELTMVDAALASGIAHRRCVFEVFARSLPSGRRYAVAAGAGRLMEAIAAFRFDDAELAYLEARGFLRPATLDWLAHYRFRGNVVGYREGELFFPGSPILTVDGTFAEAVVLETLVLSVLNHDSAVASAGARMVSAAAGRLLIEAGGRRVHEAAASAAARAAYIIGFASTSNLEAGRRWAIPTGGTIAHAFVLAHDSEAGAFATQVAAAGTATTLLVDTYDIAEGIRHAVSVAGPGLGAIRIDSGHAVAEARRARRLLDTLGARHTRIVISGDLDEHAIAALAGAPVDAMLVGTELVTGAGAPTARLVYKLVARAAEDGPDAPLLPVAKRSPGKETRGGVKFAYRRYGADGRAIGEVARVVDRVPGTAAGADNRVVVPPSTAPGTAATRGAAGTGTHDAPSGRGGSGAGRWLADLAAGLGPGTRALQIAYIDRGELVGPTDAAIARAHHQQAKAELAVHQRALTPGPPALQASGGP